MTLRSDDFEGHGSWRIFCCCISAWVALALCAGALSCIKIIPRPLARRWEIVTGSKMSCWYLAACRFPGTISQSCCSTTLHPRPSPILHHSVPSFTSAPVHVHLSIVVEKVEAALVGDAKDVSPFCSSHT